MLSQVDCNAIPAKQPQRTSLKSPEISPLDRSSKTRHASTGMPSTFRRIIRWQPSKYPTKGWRLWNTLHILDGSTGYDDSHTMKSQPPSETIGSSLDDHAVTADAIPVAAASSGLVFSLRFATMTRAFGRRSRLRHLIQVLLGLDSNRSVQSICWCASIPSVTPSRPAKPSHSFQPQGSQRELHVRRCCENDRPLPLEPHDDRSRS